MKKRVEKRSFLLHLAASGQILWCAFLVVFWTWCVFSMKIDFDYTAGELFDHAISWLNTDTLYTSLHDEPYRVFNYPPLSMILIRLLYEAGLSLLTAARLMNSVAFLCSGLLLYSCLRWRGCSRWVSVAVTSLVAASLPMMYPLGQFHIEMTAVALTLFGILILHQYKGVAPTILSALIMSTACFVKQTHAITVLIVILWLFFYHRQRAYLFLSSILFVGFVGAIQISQHFGPEAWRHMILYTVGTYSSSNLMLQLSFYFFPWIIFFAIALSSGAKNPEMRRSFWWWYFMGMTMWLLSSSRNGSSYQYFIEWHFALLLWIGPFLSRWFLRLGPALLLAVQIIGLDISTAIALHQAMKQARETESLLPNICAHLPPEPNKVVSEYSGLVRACGHEPVLHPFIMTSLARQGLWDEQNFIERLSMGSYPNLLLPFDPREELSGVHQQRWTPRMIEAINSSYGSIGTEGSWNILEPVR